MIKASSLFYTLVITLLIAIVSSSLILFAYLTRIQFQNFEVNQQLHRNADSGLNLLLAKQSLAEINQHKTIDLFNTGEDNVELTRKAWGAYEIAISKAHFKNLEVVRIAQVGYYPDSNHLYSIYIPDHDKPIAVCGKTIIKGTAFLQKSGVKRAYIEGQSFVGNNLVNGIIKKSESKLPDFNKQLIASIENVFNQQSFSDDDSVIQISNQLMNDTVVNSYLNRTVVVKSEEALKIASGVYSGNVVIISRKKITIAATASIKDIIVYAPKIIIEKEFTGNLQAFATDTLNIEKDVVLRYPSVLGIIQGVNSPNVSAIILNQGVIASGNIIVNATDKTSTKDAGVIIKEGAVVNGQMYSKGFADVKGRINGSLMCNKIMLITPSSVYENHLLNAIIDVTQLSKYYVGINLVQESNVKKVTKWLN